MPATPKKERPVSSQEESSSRSVVGHMQHLKSFGVALSKAAETYMSQHQASEASADWRDDFGRNLDEANKEFHRTLAAEASKVADVYYGEAEPDGGETKPATAATKKGGGTQTET